MSGFKWLFGELFCPTGSQKTIRGRGNIWEYITELTSVLLLFFLFVAGLRAVRSVCVVPCLLHYPLFTWSLFVQWVVVHYPLFTGSLSVQWVVVVFVRVAMCVCCPNYKVRADHREVKNATLGKEIVRFLAFYTSTPSKHQLNVKKLCVTFV